MNKLWNACRFVEMNLPTNFNYNLGEIDEKNLQLYEKWILSRLSKTIDSFNNK